MSYEQNLISNYVDGFVFKYIFDRQCSHLMQSGLIFTTQKFSGYSLPSTPYAIQCLAPKFYRGKVSKSMCKRQISDIGPFCEEHSILYQNLQVKPSNISRKIRGLFAVASKLNVAEIRHQRSTCVKTGSTEISPIRFLTESEFADIVNHKVPLFYSGDVITYYGGVFAIDKKDIRDAGPLDPNKPASYVISYSSDDAEILIDGFIESSGVARFSNSVIKKNGKTIGEEHWNAALGFGNIENTKVKIGECLLNKFPCLIACRDIFDGEEIITDYGEDYWTSEMTEQLPKETSDYLDGKTDKKPLFFKTD